MTDLQEEIDRQYRLKYSEMERLIQQIKSYELSLSDGQNQLKYLNDRLQEVTGQLIRMNQGELPDDSCDSPPADYENHDQRNYGYFNVHHS